MDYLLVSNLSNYCGVFMKATFWGKGRSVLPYAIIISLLRAALLIGVLTLLFTDWRARLNAYDEAISISQVQSEYLLGVIDSKDPERLDRYISLLSHASDVIGVVACGESISDSHEIMLSGVVASGACSNRVNPEYGDVSWGDDGALFWTLASGERIHFGVNIRMSELLGKARQEFRGFYFASVFAIFLICLAVFLLHRIQTKSLQALVQAFRRPGDDSSWHVPSWPVPGEIYYISRALRVCRKINGRFAVRARSAVTLLNALSEVGSTGVVILAVDGEILWANNVACAILGAECSELRRSSINKFLDPATATELWDDVSHCVQSDGQRPIKKNSKILSLRGEDVPVELAISPSEVIEAIVVEIRCVHSNWGVADCDMDYQTPPNVTSLSVAKYNFLASVSHEIRTPLNGLTGMLDLLKSSKLNDTQAEFLKIALSSARQLRALLNDILDLSKIEAGKLAFEVIPFDAKEQLHNSVMGFSGVAKAKGLALNIDLEIKHRLLLGDPYRICQVLNNLMDNAIKFTDYGSISVRAHTRLVDDEDIVELTVFVRDTGLGVPQEKLSTIFDAFTQAEQSTTRRYGGTGLGLSLCKQLCERMNGSIEVESQLDHGSTFTFKVHCEVAHGMSPFTETQPEENWAGDILNGCRVLIVDDNRVNQTLLQRWMEMESMEVTVVGDGEAAVDAVTELDFDIVLMDVSMPKMNGLDATRAIRGLASAEVESSKRFHRLPIIGISANAMQGDREECLQSGMSEYVTKPILRDDLLVKMALSLRRLAR